MLSDMAIHITSQTKSLRLRPTSNAELRSLIEQELERQGPDADLNFIDTSLITDMSYLLEGLFIANIKIDEWDTSNVLDMSGMFEDCYNFTGTGLGKWDVSNVYNMSHMFEGAISFVGTGIENGIRRTLFTCLGCFVVQHCIMAIFQHGTRRMW